MGVGRFSNEYCAAKLNFLRTRTQDIGCYRVDQVSLSVTLSGQNVRIFCAVLWIASSLFCSSSEEERVTVLSQMVHNELEGIFSMLFLQPVVGLRNVMVWFIAYLHRQFC